MGGARGGSTNEAGKEGAPMTQSSTQASDIAATQVSHPRASKQASTRQRIVGVLGDVLITLGVVLGLFIVWQNWWTDVSTEKVVKQERSAVLDDWGATMGPDGIIGPPAPQGSTPSGQPSGVAPTPQTTGKPNAHRGAAAGTQWSLLQVETPETTRSAGQFLVPSVSINQGLLPQGRMPVPTPPKKAPSKKGSKKGSSTSAKRAKVQTIGFIYAPALRQQRLWATPIVQGTFERALARGVGHYPGSANLGGIGNAAIAGHRTTHGAPFRHIDSLKRGDHIVIRVREKWFVYVLDRNKIVRPKDHWVLHARPFKSNFGRLLTLTSCHPLHSAARRFVWWGHLVRTVSASGPPPVELKMKR